MNSSLAHYFNFDSLFTQNYTYREFYSDVLACKIPDSDIVAIAASGIKDLIFYFAVINAGKTAILFDPEILKKDKGFRLRYFSKFLADDRNGIKSFCIFAEAESFNYIPVKIDPSATCTIIFTSGSSATPKAIELSFASLFSSAMDTIKHFKIFAHDCWAISLPLYHIGGLMIVFRTIFAEASTIFINPKNLNTELLNTPKVTIISCVELQLKRLLADSASIERCKKLKAIVLGGSKTATETINRACELEINLANTYGMSETCSMICATPICRDVDILKSSGSPLGENSIELLDGQIKIYSKSIANKISFGNYFNGEILTNDIGHLKNGLLFIEGRKDDVIISGGKNISPSFIDELIRDKFKNISYSKTFGLDDQIYGSTVITVFESSEPIDHFEFKKLLSKFLSSYQIPKMFIQTSDISNSFSGIKINLQSIKTIARNLYALNSVLKKPLIRGNINGEPLIILHGFMGSYNDYKFLIPLLEKKYLLILANLPGHHSSEVADLIKYKNFNDYTDDLNKVLKPLGKYSLIGYSLGARVSCVLATKSQEINNLILESGGLGIDDVNERKKRQLSDQCLFNNIKNQAQLNAFISKWYDQEIFKGIKSSEDYHSCSQKVFEDVEGWKYSLNIHGQYMMPSLRPDDIVSNKECCYIYGENDLKYAIVAKKFKKFCNIYKILNASHNTHATNKNSYLTTLQSILLK